MVVRDKVMAHVEVQVGPFGVVSLISRQEWMTWTSLPGLLSDPTEPGDLGSLIPALCDQ